MSRRTVKRKNSVLRTLVGNAGIDKAFKHVYDKIDDLLPDIATTGSPVLPREAPIGKTLLSQNDDGQNVIAIRTEKGWETDINAKLSVVSDARNFRTSSGLNSLNRKPVEGESLKYNKEGHLVTYNKLIVNSTLTTRSNATIGGDLTVSGNDIKNSDSEVTITMNTDQDVTIAGDLTVTGNNITFGNGESIMNNTDNNVQITTSTDSNGGLSVVAGGGSSKIITKSVNADAFTMFQDGASAKWAIGYDYSDSGKFKINNASTLVDSSTLTLDTNAALELFGTSASLKLSYNADDYATISLADTADLTIATVGTGTRDSDITLDADGKILLESAAGGVYIAEAGNASADSDAYGQLWVKSDAPNNLYFTDDTGQDIPLTNNGKARTWTNTSGGYKTNNNSSTVYYFQYYPNYHSWGNGDSSPTGLTFTDSYSYQWCATSPGVLTNISVTLRAFDTGLTDPVKFYVYKGVPANGATSTVLTLIGTTGTITPIASRQMVLSTDISSSNDFDAGDKLWVMYKKDSTSGNQDLYFAVTISGEYT